MKQYSTRKIVAISFFAALATALMWFPKFPLLPAAPFLTYDFSDVPVLIGTFSLGPVAGVIIVFIKNVLYFITRARSGPIGTLMNWSTTTVFILVAGFVYHYVRKNRLGAVMGMLLGTLAFTVVGVIMNIYVALPAWGIPADRIEGLVRGAVIPFNLLRGGISTVATMILYRRTTDIIRQQLRL